MKIRTQYILRAILLAWLLACLPCGYAFSQKRIVKRPSVSKPTTSVSKHTGDASKIRRDKSGKTNAKSKTDVSPKSFSESSAGTQPQVFGRYSTESLPDETITVNGISFVMKGVQGGTFTMGATPEQGGDVGSDEKPAHRVAVSSFRIGQTEVTQGLWEAVMGSNPSRFKGANLPVEEVSWDDCREFIRKLNGLTGKSFRLPTEAEWEYAARGGSKSRGYKYSGSDNIDDVAWNDDNSGGKTHAVGQKQANELGLYDMSGNVWEWCQDWYGSYGSSAQTNPAGPASGSYRVSRGGRWSSGARDCRVSYRYYNSPSIRNFNLGLRLAL